jgi:hypothetical protein
MFIKNGLRFNIYPKFTDPDTGESGIDLASNPTRRLQYGITEIPDPNRESDETHYNQEINEAPYLICTPKAPEVLVALRWSKLKQVRDNLTENGGCLVDTKWFHTDTKSKQQQMALVMLGANIPANLQWKTMDGSFVTMTQALAAQVFAAQIAREQLIFVTAETKNTDSTPIAEGWPDKYVENI